MPVCLFVKIGDGCLKMVGGLIGDGGEEGVTKEAWKCDFPGIFSRYNADNKNLVYHETQITVINDK